MAEAMLSTFSGIVLSPEEGCIADPCAWDAVETTAAAAHPATAA